MTGFEAWAWGFTWGVFLTIGVAFLCRSEARAGYQPKGGGRPPSKPPSGGTLGRKPSIK